MPYETEEIVAALRNARELKQLSQRDLSALAGVAQAHISKIENGAVDTRLSSLVELARALDLEVMLVPRKLVPAVEAIVRSGSAQAVPSDSAKDLRRLREAITSLQGLPADEEELARFKRALSNLTQWRLGPDELAAVRGATKFVRQAQNRTELMPVLKKWTRTFEELRNRLVHDVTAPAQAVRPAYTLDDEDDDG
jgi:transcriptional regulator with XRE-family HTH domain